MTSLPKETIRQPLWMHQKSEWANSLAFRVKWLDRRVVEFRYLRHLESLLNPGQRLYYPQDGEEVPAAFAEAVIDQMNT